MIIEKGEERFVVLAFTDLDGTVNNQAVAEKNRLGTIAPAKNAIEELQKHNIPVGIITARSFGETKLYKDALGVNGFTIAEDGAIIIMPKNIEADTIALTHDKHIISYENEKVLILSEVEAPVIKEFLNNISRQLEKQGLPQNLISTCTSTPQALKEIIKYQTLDDAMRAADRVASAFVRDVTGEQYRIITENADSWNLHIVGTPHHAHILGKDADKGNAIKFINDNIDLFFPNDKNIDGILPIVFGNDYNDLRLFEEAHGMGGLSVMVKDTNGHYRVPEENIAPYVIKTDSPYGYGMKEALTKIFDRLTLQ